MPETRAAYASTPERGRISADGDRRQRSEQVLVRLTPTEAADARRLAAQHGLTLPALLRAGLTYLDAMEPTMPATAR